MGERILFWIVDNIFPWFLIALLLCLFVLVVAGVIAFFTPTEPVTGGPVVRKTHHAAHTTTMYVQSGNVMVPMTTYHPESWGIVVRAENKNREEELVELPQSEWEPIQVGDYWRRNK